MSAHKKIMDYLAVRAHSEKELREKLSRAFPQDEIDHAVDHARDKGWLTDPLQLATEVAENLSRRGKSSAYIQDYLRNKGLPPVRQEKSVELEKAFSLVERHLRIEPPFEFEQQNAVLRLLKNRGFDYEVARTVAKSQTKLSGE